MCVDVCFPTEPPSAPLNLQVTETNPTSVTIVWEPPETDGGTPILAYVIETRTAKETKYSFAGKAEPEDNSYIVTGLKEGARYLFRVRAENKAGSSDAVKLEKPVKVGMTKEEKKAAKEKLRKSSIGEQKDEDEKVEITEKKVVTTDEQKVVGKEKKVTEEETVTMSKTETVTVEDIKETTVSTEETVSSTKGKTVVEEPVESKDNKPLAVTPQPPKDLQAKSTSSDSITLSWSTPAVTTSEDLTGYVVEMKSELDSDFAVINTLEPIKYSHIVGGLQKGTKYEFRVRSQGCEGLSEAAELESPVTVKAKVTKGM